MNARAIIETSFEADLDKYYEIPPLKCGDTIDIVELPGSTWKNQKDWKVIGISHDVTNPHNPLSLVYVKKNYNVITIYQYQCKNIRRAADPVVESFESDLDKYYALEPKLGDTVRCCGGPYAGKLFTVICNPNRQTYDKFLFVRLKGSTYSTWVSRSYLTVVAKTVVESFESDLDKYYDNHGPLKAGDTVTLVHRPRAGHCTVLGTGRNSADSANPLCYITCMGRARWEFATELKRVKT